MGDKEITIISPATSIVCGGMTMMSGCTDVLSSPSIIILIVIIAFTAIWEKR